MEDCAECQRMLSEPVVLPKVFMVPESSPDQRRVGQRQVHERAECDGISHMEAGARLFVEGFAHAPEPLTVDTFVATKDGLYSFVGEVTASESDDEPNAIITVNGVAHVIVTLPRGITKTKLSSVARLRVGDRVAIAGHDIAEGRLHVMQIA